MLPVDDGRVIHWQPTMHCLYECTGTVVFMYSRVERHILDIGGHWGCSVRTGWNEYIATCRVRSPVTCTLYRDQDWRCDRFASPQVQSLGVMFEVRGNVPQTCPATHSWDQLFRIISRALPRWWDIRYW